MSLIVGGNYIKAVLDVVVAPIILSLSLALEFVLLIIRVGIILFVKALRQEETSLNNVSIYRTFDLSTFFLKSRLIACLQSCLVVVYKKLFYNLDKWGRFFV